MSSVQDLNGDLAQRAWRDVSAWSEALAERNYRALCKRQAALVGYTSGALEEESDAVFALAIDLLLTLDRCHEVAAGIPVAPIGEDVVVTAVTAAEEFLPTLPTEPELFIRAVLDSGEFAAPELPATLAALLLAAFDELPEIDDEAAAVLLAFVCVAARVYEEAQRIAPHPARPSSRAAAKVGRNDPCPCGSGAKYKRCCGQREANPPAAPPSRAEGRLLEYIHCAEDVLSFAEGETGPDASWYRRQRAAWEDEFPVDAELVPESIGLGRSLFDIALPKAGVSAAELYGRKEGRQLDAKRRRLLRELCDSYLAFYEFTGRSEGLATFREVGSGVTWRACDPEAPEDFEFEIGELWLCRLVGPRDDAIVFGEPLVYPPEALQDIEEMVEALLREVADAGGAGGDLPFARVMKDSGAQLADYIAATVPEVDDDGRDGDEEDDAALEVDADGDEESSEEDDEDQR